MSSPGRAPRKRRSNRVRKFFKVILLAMIGLYIGWVSFNYVKDVLKASLVATAVANYGNIESSISFDGLLVRDETVFSSPRSGKLQIITEEGERVRVGGTVASIHVPDVNGKNGTSIANISSPVAGIVSYHVDGLENVFVPENIDKMDIIAHWQQKPVEVRNWPDSSNVEAGQLVGKVVNNLSPILILGEINKKSISSTTLKDSEKVTVQIGDKKLQPLYLKVLEVKPVADNFRFVLEFNNYTSDFLKERVHKFKLITEWYEGYVVPKDALVYKDEAAGLYIVYKNFLVWKQVEVVGLVEGQAAVTGLDPDTTYVKNPEYATEGQPVD